VRATDEWKDNIKADLEGKIEKGVDWILLFITGTSHRLL
jgi:uncharacterized phage-like protein YoqJ